MVLLQLMKDCVGDWGSVCLRLVFVLDYLLQGRMVFLSPLHFEEGWHSPFPRASLGKNGVGFNDSHQGERCWRLRDCSVLYHCDPSPSCSL